MAKQTFKAKGPTGKTIAIVEYTPLIYIAGTEVHRLALHKEANRALPDEMKTWSVSEPISGSRVCEVFGDHKGLRVSSRSYGPRDARNAAMATLDALLERIGSDKFNTVIKTAKEKAQPTGWTSVSSGAPTAPRSS